MGIETALLAAGLGLAAAGTATQVIGQQKAASAQKRALDQQTQIQQQQQQQMELDATRRKRDIVRQQLAARSSALAAATSQGAQYGSALPGAYGSIDSQANEATLGVNQNLSIGRNIFGANQAMLGDYRDAAGWSSMGNLGGSLSSLGGGILNNITNLTRAGKYFGLG